MIPFYLPAIATALLALQLRPDLNFVVFLVSVYYKRFKLIMAYFRCYAWAWP